MSSSDQSYNIAIIGFGPKGLYGFERLITQLIHSESRVPVVIHIFNANPFFGAGDIYRPDQPSYLLMNYANRYIDMWDRNSKLQPLKQLPTYCDWLKNNKLSDTKKVDHAISSRAMVGQYLTDGFLKILAVTPRHVKIKLHHSEVYDLQKKDYLYKIYHRTKSKQKKKKLTGISQVLISTGHALSVTNENSKREKFKSIYPVSNLNSILESKKVALKGMGLTFIDATLALTEGRGGKFKNQNNQYVYLPSGKEPSVLFPFSTTGYFMIPRKEEWKFGSKCYYFTRENIEEIKSAKNSKKYDFEKDLWPLIIQEITVEYYRVLFKNEGQELKIKKIFSEVEKQIDTFHLLNPQLEKWSWEKLFAQDPDKKNTHQAILANLKMVSNWAEEGESRNPFIAATGVWRKVSQLFSEIYKNGGLTPSSQAIFLKKYFPHLNRVAYGPPLCNVKKIIALAEVGFIDFSFSKSPEVKDVCDGTYILRNKNKITRVDYLVDARIPKSYTTKDPMPLFENLLENNIFHPFINRDKHDTIVFQPGCMSLNKKGHPISNSKNPDPNITVIGTPTEGFTFDNDTLSRKRNDFVSDWAKQTMKNITSYSKIKKVNAISRR